MLNFFFGNKKIAQGNECGFLGEMRSGDQKNGTQPIKSGIISSLLEGEVRVAEGGQPGRRTVTGGPSVSDREIWQATDTGKNLLMRDRS